MKARLVLPAVALLAALGALVLGGCGGGSSGAELADLAPPGSVAFVEGAVRPTGELASSVDAVAERVGGIDNLGDYIVTKLESSARDDGEPLDFAKEVEPWLGERAAVTFQRLQDGNLSEPIVAVESTDAEATRKFVESRAADGKDPYRSASYKGVDYEVGGSEGNAMGVVEDSLVVGDEQSFKATVDASQGDALGGEDRFEQAIAAASDGSLADAYVDVGALIEQSGGSIDPQARQILQNAGIDPSDATAVASVVPDSDRVEVDLSSDLGGEKPPSGDASELLGSLPGDAFAAIAASGFNEQVNEAIDALDEKGIANTVPPGQLKKGLKELGIDLEGLANSLEEGAVFAAGDSKDSLGGALVLTTKGSEAATTVGNIAKLLRSVQVAGVSVLGGKLDGFSVRSAELGPKPLVVVAKEGRIAIGYGLPAALAGLASESGRTLADEPAYEEAVSSLGDTPISGFADGPAALRLADSLISSSEEGFEEAKPYLRHISFLALGTGSEGELATAKLIVGLK
jgi:Protein of unknown function (DUF3352)